MVISSNAARTRSAAPAFLLNKPVARWEGIYIVRVSTKIAIAHCSTRLRKRSFRGAGSRRCLYRRPEIRLTFDSKVTRIKVYGTWGGRKYLRLRITRWGLVVKRVRRRHVASGLQSGYNVAIWSRLSRYLFVLLSTKVRLCSRFSHDISAIAVTFTCRDHEF